MKEQLKILRPSLPPLGGALLVLGEHVWSAHGARLYVSGVGAALLIAALVWSIVAARAWEGEPGGRGRSGWSPVWPTGLFVAAALLYFLSTLLSPHDGEGIDWPAILGWGWALALVAGAVLYIFIEAALMTQGRSPRMEGARLRAARNGGLALALLLALAVTLNFAFARLPWQWDLGYFQSAQPSEATRQVVAELESKVEVALFYPSHNSVLSLLRDYFGGIEAISSQISIDYYDAELDPREGRRFKVRENGVVVVGRGSVQQKIKVPLELTKARAALAKFDASFLTELIKVSRRKRTAYLTVGHGERNEAAEGNVPLTGRVEGLKKLLQARNFTVKPLGLAEGLGRDIPDDAALVLVVGPATPLQPVEADALARYVERGGSLMVFLEPGPGEDGTGGRSPNLSKMLARYGANYSPVQWANDRIFGRRTHTRADHALLVTARYMAHPSVERLRRNAAQNPLLFLVAGAWNKGKPPEGYRVQETIKGMPGSWEDRNGNFQFDSGTERRGEPILALAIFAPPPPAAAEEAQEEPRGRILAFGDADVASDLFFQNRANQLALLEGIAWLATEEAPPGLPESGEDLKLQHVKGDELIWFYLPVFAVPGLVLGGGWFLTRRRARRAAGGDDA